MDDLEEVRKCRQWKEEALDHTLSRTYFVRDSGPVIRQRGIETLDCINCNRISPRLRLTVQLI